MPPEQRAEIEEVRDFARIARENLYLADDFLASVREPIAVEKQVIAGEVDALVCGVGTGGGWSALSIRMFTTVR